MQNSPNGEGFRLSEVRKEEREIQNSAKIDVMAPAKLHPLPKNEKTRWKIFAQRKNTAQKNPREISGTVALSEKTL
jgi:hypothetical protein